MTKIKGPLFSKSARGSVGKKITFRSTKHGSVVTGRGFPGSVNSISPSQAQLDRRAKFSSAAAGWSALSVAEKDGYNVLAIPENISGWNLYLRKKLGGSPIDWTNPLTNDLVASFMVIDGQALVIRDLVSGVDFPNGNASVVSYLSNLNGVGARFNNSIDGSAQGFGFLVGDIPALQLSSEISIVQGAVMRDNPGGANWGRLVSKSNGATSDEWGIATKSASSGLPRGLHFRLATVGLDVAPIPAEVYFNIAVRYKPGFKVVNIDGLSVASTSAQSVPIQEIGFVQIGNHGTAVGRGFRGDIFYTHIFSKSLSDSDVLSLHNDPYQFIN